MPVPAAHTAIPADTAQAQSPAGTPEVFVPRYIHGFERSTPLKETDPAERPARNHNRHTRRIPV